MRGRLARFLILVQIHKVNNIKIHSFLVKWWSNVHQESIVNISVQSHSFKFRIVDFPIYFINPRILTLSSQGDKKLDFKFSKFLMLHVIELKTSLNCVFCQFLWLCFVSGIEWARIHLHHKEWLYSNTTFSSNWFSFLFQHKSFLTSKNLGNPNSIGIFHWKCQ